MASITSNINNSYKLIQMNESFKYQSYIHASHAMLWCEDNRQNQTIIYGLMQIRRDGMLGFPGGKSDEKVIDSNEIVSTLNRELKEEINYQSSVIAIDDHLFSHVGNNIVLHFFGKQLPIEEFDNMEKTHMNARDFPHESLGVFRVPFSARGSDSFAPTLKFFSGFSRQTFAGNARQQLILAAIKMKLIGQKDIVEIVKHMK